MTEAKFARIETVAQLKKLMLATGSTGLTYSVRFEMGYDQASLVAKMFGAKVPLSLEWVPEGADEVFSLGNVTALKPSSLSTDADGEVRFLATFALPASAIGQSIGVLAVGLHNNPVEGPVGRLTLEATQSNAGL